MQKLGNLAKQCHIGKLLLSLQIKFGEIICSVLPVSVNDTSGHLQDCHHCDNCSYYRAQVNFRTPIFFSVVPCPCFGKALNLQAGCPVLRMDNHLSDWYLLSRRLTMLVINWQQFWGRDLIRWHWGACALVFHFTKVENPFEAPTKLFSINIDQEQEVIFFSISLEIYPAPHGEDVQIFIYNTKLVKKRLTSNVVGVKRRPW